MANTERINKLSELCATLEEGAKNIRERVDRMDDRLVNDSKQNSSTFTEMRDTHHHVDKSLAVAVENLERLEKKVDDLLSRRWELWKIILAAFLGSLLALGAGLASRWFERRFLDSPDRAAAVSAISSPGR